MLTTQADRFSAEEVGALPRTIILWLFEQFELDWTLKGEKKKNLNLIFCPQMEQMFVAFPPDVAGNLDYKNLVHIITHGEEKDQE